MIRFEDIQDTVKGNHPKADLEILRKAYIFSAVEHKGQVRASGEPYLVHPLEVANILAEMRMDPICVAVGLLHDVLEDTLTTPDEYTRRKRELLDRLKKLEEKYARGELTDHNYNLIRRDYESQLEELDPE